MIKVTIWYERLEEATVPAVLQAYPEGMSEAIAQGLRCDDIQVRQVYLQDPDCGITPELLKDTDVLMWWGHMGHHLVPDSVAQLVKDEVLKGMGAIFLHSAHFSKPFRALMGTACTLTWRENGDVERVWVTNPAHPIAQGVNRYIRLAHEETYGEPFDIPEPDELVFIGGFSGGEVFRSGCCFRRGAGKIFYFQPGHETVPTYFNEDVRTVLRNAVRWAAPAYRTDTLDCPHVAIPE